MTLASRAKLDADQAGFASAVVADLEALSGGGGSGLVTLDKTDAPGASPGSYTNDPTTLSSNLLNVLLAAIGIPNWDAAIPTTLAAALAHYTANGAHGLYTGSGAPEGAVSATAPAIYVRSNGAIYGKTGSGTSGWIAFGGTMVNPNSIDTFSPAPFGIGGRLNGGMWGESGTGAWPAANRALLVPFVMVADGTIKRMFYRKSASGSGGNVDLGIYDESGAKLRSTGSVALESGVNLLDFADLSVAAGRYYLAMSHDSTSSFSNLGGTPVAEKLRMAGCAQMSSAFPLPSTFTKAAVSGDFLPVFGCEIGSIT